LNEFLIKELDIEEFRGIRKLAKPIKLTKFNIIIGRNNTGKTAILEALYLLSMPYTPYHDPIYDKSRIDLIAELHGGISSLVYGYSGVATLKYSLSKGVEITPSKDVVTISTPPSITVKNITLKLTQNGNVNILLEGIKISDSDYVEFLKALGAEPNTPPLCIYIPNNSQTYRQIRDFILKDETWSSIEKKGLHSKVVKELLTPTVYDKFTEILIKKDKLSIRKEVEEGIGPLYIDIDSLGEGIKRTTLAYLTIEHLNPKIVLWDDIETATHPGLLETIIKWLTNKPRQTIITTHSLDVLYEIAYLEPKECNIIALKKNKDDTINHRTLSPDELEDLIDKGIDIRKIVDILEL